MIFLDSGAFSSWKRGATIDLNEYVRFIQRNQSHIDAYVNLDVIPGLSGRREHRREQIEQAAALSYANQRRMKAAGLSPLPVFHQDEDFHWLRQMLDDDEPFIALSPSTRAHSTHIMRWLDQCFELIPRDVKTHGLGVTSPSLCRHFPWTSLDSTTWALQAGNGKIPVPRYDGAEPDYLLDPIYLAVTHRTRYATADHVDTIPDFRLDWVHKFLTEVGIDLAYARYCQLSRYRIWLEYFRRLEASCGLTIVYATDTSRQQHEVLNRAKIETRLLSYFHLRSLPETALADYVAGRIRPGRKSKPPKMDFYSDAYVRWRALGLHDRNVAYEARETRSLGDDFGLKPSGVG
jgi:hypothetical protein